MTPEGMHCRGKQYICLYKRLFCVAKCLLGKVKKKKNGLLRQHNGIPKVHYTYCSIRGRLFNCTCCTKDEAQRLCEDWLVKQDRCYIN